MYGYTRDVLFSSVLFEVDTVAHLTKIQPGKNSNTCAIFLLLESLIGRTGA